MISEISGTNFTSLVKEYPTRIMRAKALMAERDLDGLLLITGANLAYFTGMPCEKSGSRPFVYILPQGGEPILIVQDGRQFEASLFTKISDIRTYSRLSHLPFETVEGALKDRGLLTGRIGVELGGEMVMDIPFSDYIELQNRLPEVSFEDASPLLWQLRMIKSQAEIERIAGACTITMEAYGRTFGMVEAGMRESEIQRIMICQMLELGGGSPWVLITSGQGNYDLVSKSGGDRLVQPGDMIWMDCGCQVEGYYSDFGRAGVVGGASKEQEEAQRAIQQITRQAIKMLQPETPVAEVASYCNTAVADLKFPVTSNISGLASRVGHGLGMAVTELPSLSEGDSSELEAGMVVTIEPGVATQYGTFHIEENVVITDKGPQVLTEGHGQLWTI